MPSAKAVLGSVLGRFLFRESTLVRAEWLSDRCRRLVLAGGSLRDVRWTPGDKVQVHLPNVGMRTYTPARWDAINGEAELIAYVHGEAPGSVWARDLALASRVQLFGPRRSLAVGGAQVIVVGDETSIALALANGVAEPAIFEVSEREQIRTAMATLGMRDATLVARAPDDSHLAELIDAIAATLTRTPNATLALSGRAQMIQTIRRGLKRRSIQPRTTIAKAYWAPGKVGLD